MGALLREVLARWCSASRCCFHTDVKVVRSGSPLEKQSVCDRLTRSLVKLVPRDACLSAVSGGGVLERTKKNCGAEAKNDNSVSLELAPHCLHFLIFILGHLHIGR